MLYGERHTAHKARVSHARDARFEAGCVQRMRRARARLEIVISREILLEEVSLVDVLVECKIVLRHPLPAAPRRDEVEAAARLPAARLLEFVLVNSLLALSKLLRPLPLHRHLATPPVRHRIRK